MNAELVTHYWELGEYISRKIASAEWGDGVVEDLAADLARRYSGVRGYTRPNLFRMRQFYEAYRSNRKVSPLVRQLPWTHHLIILSQAKPVETRSMNTTPMFDVEQRDKSVISRHIKNVFEESELEPGATVASFATVQRDRGRRVDATRLARAALARSTRDAAAPLDAPRAARPLCHDSCAMCHRRLRSVPRFLCNVSPAPAQWVSCACTLGTSRVRSRSSPVRGGLLARAPWVCCACAVSSLRGCSLSPARARWPSSWVRSVLLAGVPPTNRGAGAPLLLTTAEVPPLRAAGPATGPGATGGDADGADA